MIYDTLYLSAFLEKYDTLEYSKVKCYSGDSVRLRNINSIEYKKRQQVFLAPLPGKQLAKDIIDSLIYFTSLSPLTLAGLSLLSLSFNRCRVVHDRFRPTK